MVAGIAALMVIAGVASEWSKVLDVAHRSYDPYSTTVETEEEESPTGDDEAEAQR